MKKIFLIFVFNLLYIITLFSQFNLDIFDKFIGKWNLNYEEIDGFETWEKTNDKKIIINNYKIFSTDTIHFNTEEIVIKKGNIFLNLVSGSNTNNAKIENSFQLIGIEDNHYVFVNKLKDEIISINYLIKDDNHIYFWIEFENNSFNVDYMLIRDNE